MKKKTVTEKQVVALKKREASQYLDVSIRSLERYTAQGKLIPTYKKGPHGQEAIFSQDQLDRLKKEMANGFPGHKRSKKPTDELTKDELLELIDDQMQLIDELLELIDRQQEWIMDLPQRQGEPLHEFYNRMHETLDPLQIINVIDALPGRDKQVISACRNRQQMRKRSIQ